MIQKTIVIALISIIFYVEASSQDCEKLQKHNIELSRLVTENDDKIKSLNNELNISNKENNYLKEALLLTNSKIDSNIQDFIFKINNVSGNIDEGKISITGLVENKGAISSLQISGVQIIDPKGNQYKSSEFSFGNSGIRISEFQRNIPIKFTIEFTSIIEETPILKALILTTFDRKYPGRKNTGIFKNLRVTWN